MTKNYLDILAETIRNNWDQPALTDFYLTEDGKAQDTSRGSHYTYGEMYAEIVRVANFLTQLGLRKGDHIAICGANSSHWVIAYLAIAKMQGVSVTIMHSLMPEQIAQLVNFSDAKALFTDTDIWTDLKNHPLPQVENVISLEDWSVLHGIRSRISNPESRIDNREICFPQVEPDDLATICFTSGTSEKPKGVMSSYGNISISLLETYNVFIREDEFIKKSLSILPISHIYGLGGHIIPLVCGVHITIVCDLIKFVQNGEFLHQIGPNLIFTIPLVVQYLIKDDFFSIFLRKKVLKNLIVGGARITEKIEDVGRNMEIPIVQVYGSTETTAPVSMSSYCNYRKDSSGKVVSTVDAHIAPNGEILVKGENVMLGYYKDPEATAAKIDKDGWLHTGDKGHLDEDGYLYVEGRLEQDIIVLPNGENIRPDNIESLINALPEVSESLVLARDGKLIALVVSSKEIINLKFEIINNGTLRRSVLRTINPQLPLYSQLYDVEILNEPLARTEKQTIKRYLYK